ncbi:MAG: SPOR domain-containing protein [Gemmatimonadetes bacterium]|nr:SPOR domain-containing protein [Gemmatimonadota bacterium]
MVEQAETPLAPVGLFWKGRVLLEQGDVGPACDALHEATRRSAPDAIELRNQVEFYAQRCRDTATATSPPAGGAPPGGAGAVPAPAPASAGAAPPPAASSPGGAAPTTRVAPDATRAPAGGWSLQVSAHKTKAEALKAMRTLANRGYQARVDGTAAPFRVRIGRYATEAEATKDLVRAKKKGLKGARVVRAEGP